MSLPSQSDMLLIERVLYALWAPHDVDPQHRAELINDATADHLTVNDVIRARRAFARLHTDSIGKADNDGR